MGERIKWADRVFGQNVPAEFYPELLERLRGTPARLEEKVGALSRDLLVRRDGNKWSIQEHAGHLIDVEELFFGRLDDYEAGLQALRPADLSGRKTYEADHNRSAIATILARFRAERTKYLSRLQGWDAKAFATSAIHPRLNRPMRACDMLHFQAEHDDYHLARMTELIERFEMS